MASTDMLDLDVVTLDKKLFTGKVKQLTVPTAMGEITILPHHAALISSVVAGELRLKVNEGEGIYDPDYIYIAVGDGFLEVKPGSRVSIMAENALRVDEIDEAKALEAKAKAEQMIRDYETGKLQLSDQEFAALSGQFSRTLAELKVLKRKRR